MEVTMEIMKETDKEVFKFAEKGGRNSIIYWLLNMQHDFPVHFLRYFLCCFLFWKAKKPPTVTTEGLNLLLILFLQLTYFHLRKF